MNHPKIEDFRTNKNNRGRRIISLFLSFFCIPYPYSFSFCFLIIILPKKPRKSQKERKRVGNRKNQELCYGVLFLGTLAAKEEEKLLQRNNEDIVKKRREKFFFAQQLYKKNETRTKDQ